jgi:hypothetical protein
VDKGIGKVEEREANWERELLKRKTIMEGKAIDGCRF